MEQGQGARCTYGGIPVTIGDNLWIGGAATILAAIIDAGSVVTHDVSAGATVVGKPARARP